MEDSSSSSDSSSSDTPSEEISDEQYPDDYDEDAAFEVELGKQLAAFDNEEGYDPEKYLRADP